MKKKWYGWSTIHFVGIIGYEDWYMEFLQYCWMLLVHHSRILIEDLATVFG